MTAISITRALAEVKSLDDRIAKAVQSGAFVAVTQGKGDRRRMTSTSASIQTVEQSIKSAYMSITDMINRRKALKAAVIRSNAETTVTIGTVSMTVAEAIERKNSIKLEGLLVHTIQRQLGAANQQVAVANQKLADDVEKATSAAYGSDKTKLTPEMFESIAAPRRTEYEAAVLDPLSMTTGLTAMMDAVDSFITEVDFVLSESNAKTTITV